VQMERPTEKEVLVRLDELVRKHPNADLLVLSEYTFMEPVPQKIKDWCREHRRYLVVGGEDPRPRGKFYNTAFVISPAGEIVFRQVKSVPIQFFKDGLPAPDQSVWESPWGRIGLCICYDLSYSRVTYRLVRLGAQALIVPTMDVADWGQRQHELHGRVAPLRAAEYGIPIFRLASSGISQAVSGDGRLMATAPCPGYGATLLGQLELPARGRLPLDRWLAPFATGVTAAVLLWLLVGRLDRVGSRTPPRSL
jgi:apolipoprotein N-acyltransferase